VDFGTTFTTVLFELLVLYCINGFQMCFRNQ